MCKETVRGQAKTCQAATTCSQVCSSGEFCDSSNTCQDGIMYIYEKHKQSHAIILVICFVTSDCATVTGYTSCKELTVGGPLTCQAPSTCLSTMPCLDGEYCTSDDICLSPGLAYIYLVLRYDIAYYLSVLHYKY